MKHLCWDSFFVGWLSAFATLFVVTNEWGGVIFCLAAAWFFGWAMDYKARRREEELSE